jgi:hypothetical protein
VAHGDGQHATKRIKIFALVVPDVRCRRLSPGDRLLQYIATVKKIAAFLATACEGEELIEVIAC